MKVKINQELKDVDGKAIQAGAKPRLLLQDVCINALLTPNQKDEEKQKWDKYELYKKVRDAKAEVELLAEEISLIKKSIAIVNPPLIMGQAWEMLENK